jgi:hypothetical protein
MRMLLACYSSVVDGGIRRHRMTWPEGLDGQLGTCLKEGRALGQRYKKA